MDSWNDIAARLVELVKDDEELHDAVVRAINASALRQEAQAAHIAQLAAYKKMQVERASKNGTRA